MAVSIDLNNVNVPGQVSLGLPPTSPSHAIPNSDPRVAIRGSAQTIGINLNLSAPIDLAPLVPLNGAGVAVAKYIPVRIVVMNPSGNASSAALEVWTGAGGTGTKLVTATTLTNLTASTKFISLSLNALTDYVTSANVYPRLTTAAGSAMTCDIYMIFEDVSNA